VTFVAGDLETGRARNDASEAALVSAISESHFSAALQ
jgi:hypothetical protein